MKQKFKTFAQIKRLIRDGKTVEYKDAIELPAIRFRIVLLGMKERGYVWRPWPMAWQVPTKITY